MAHGQSLCTRMRSLHNLAGLVTMVFTVLLRLDQVLLSFLSGGDNSEVGFYGAAFRLVEATMFISWSFAAAFLPWVARREREETQRLADGYELALKALSGTLPSQRALPATMCATPFARAWLRRGEGFLSPPAIFSGTCAPTCGLSR